MENSSSCISLGKKVLSLTIADFYLKKIEYKLNKLDFTPRLVGILSNSDPSAIKYSESTKKACDNLKITYELIIIEREKIISLLSKLVTDEKINGIIVYYPIYNDQRDDEIKKVISLNKDIEGLNSLNYEYLYSHNNSIEPVFKKKKNLIPCTPLAITKILKFLKIYDDKLGYGNRLQNRNILIMNRSNVVGKPLAVLLAKEGAIVYSYDIDTLQVFSKSDSPKTFDYQIKNLDFDSNPVLKISPLCSVIITGVPSSSFKFKTSYIRKGAYALNFSSYKNFEDDVLTRASYFLPSIGKVTIAMLLKNLLRLIENNRLIS